MSTIQNWFEIAVYCWSCCIIRTTTEDERNDKYHRLLAASLQALSMLLLALSDNQREEITHKLHPLLKNAKSWKFGKHAVGMVCYKMCYLICC